MQYCAKEAFGGFTLWNFTIVSALHLFSYEDWKSSICGLRMQSDSCKWSAWHSCKSWSPSAPKFSLIHAGVHFLMSVNWWTTRKRRGDRTTQGMVPETIQVLYRDPDPQRQHLQTSWYPCRPCWSLHSSAANHTPPSLLASYVNLYPLFQNTDT